MPATLNAKVVRIAANQSSSDAVLDLLTGKQVVLWRGAAAVIQGALFIDEPSEDTLRTDLAEITNLRLIIRKHNFRGAVLVDKSVDTTDDSVIYSDWVALASQHFTFDLTEEETNATLGSSGKLPIFFAIEASTAEKTYVAAWGYGTIEDVGITDVGEAPEVVNETEFGSQVLTIDQTELVVAFNFPKTSAAYVFERLYVKDTSDSPQLIVPVVQAQTVDGFTLKLPVLPTSNNCTLYWKVETPSSARVSIFNPEAPHYALEPTGGWVKNFDVFVPQGTVIYASKIATVDSNTESGGGSAAAANVAALNAALLAIRTNPAGGRLISDGATLINAPLIIGNNTEIECLAPECGFFLASGSNCHMLRNSLFVGNGTVPLPGTFNKNIVIRGGTWNGNYAGQTKYVNNAVGSVQLTCGMWFSGVDGLTVEGAQIFDARTFAFMASYINNPYVKYLISEWATLHHDDNNDGVHFWGPITGSLTLSSIKVKNASDDAIALNFGESAADNGGFPAAVSARHTLVEDVFAENCTGLIRLDADHATVGTVIIRNVKETVTDDADQQHAAILTAHGLWDKLVLDEVSVVYPASMPNNNYRNITLTPTNPQCVVELRNCKFDCNPENPTVVELASLITINPGSKGIKSLVLDNVTSDRHSGSPAGAVVYVANSAEVDYGGIGQLTVKGCTFVDYATILALIRPSADVAEMIFSLNTIGAASLYSNNAPLALRTATLIEQATVAPTLLNGWVNYGNISGAPSSTAGYYKGLDGTIHLKGFIKSGSTTPGLPIFTLPVGYRPFGYRYFVTVSNDSAAGVVQIDPFGGVNFIAGSNASFSLEGIAFRTD